MPDFASEGLSDFLVSEGNVTFPGRLIDLGPYPGLILTAEGNVEGELYRITDPNGLRKLDTFERFDPQDTSMLDRENGTGSLYRRRTVYVRGGLPAYVYEYNGEWINQEIRRGRLIENSNWQTYKQKRDAS